MTETIDITPTWEGALLVMLAAWENSRSPEVMSELRRMARLADWCVRNFGDVEALVRECPASEAAKRLAHELKGA